MVEVRVNSTCIVGPTKTCVVATLPDDGTMVLKHVGLAPDITFCNLFYYIVISALCWFLKVWNIRKCTL